MKAHTAHDPLPTQTPAVCHPSLLFLLLLMMMNQQQHLHRNHLQAMIPSAEITNTIVAEKQQSNTQLP